MYINRFTIILTSVLILSSCASGMRNNDIFQMNEIHDFDNAPLFGIVFNSKNKPCTGAEILLTDPEDQKVIYNVSSDINGRFMIPNLNKGTHKVSISKEGFEKGVVEFDFVDATQVLYIQLTSLESLLESAENHIDKRSLKEAALDLDRAYEIDSTSLETLYLQAVLYKLEGNDEKSLEKLEEIREFNSEF